jgi:hypothetical protein
VHNAGTIKTETANVAPVDMIKLAPLFGSGEITSQTRAKAVPPRKYRSPNLRTPEQTLLAFISKLVEEDEVPRWNSSAHIRKRRHGSVAADNDAMAYQYEC